INGSYHKDFEFCEGHEEIINNMKRCEKAEVVVEIVYEKTCNFVCNSKFGFFKNFLCDLLKCELVPKKKIVYIQPCELGAIDEPFGSPPGQLISKLNQIDPDGKSPITGALQVAGDHIESMDTEGLEMHIILITSGDESCSGNPVQVTKELGERGIYVNVISFENTNKTAFLNDLAEAGGSPLEGDIKYTVLKTGSEINYLIDEILAVNNPEECNGEDDDCDGKTDEDLVRECETECGGGVQFCKNGSWGGCVDPNSITEETIPDIAPEICDGVDNDCNGDIDELFPVGEACSKTSGSCVSVGEFVCSPDHSGVVCNASTPVSAPEICDNKDNDCDGKADEDLSLPCENGCGTGYKTCSAGQWGSCQITKPHAELCDGADNDCDGLVDEGFNVGKECSVGSGQCAKYGKYVCSGDGLTSECSVKGGGSSGAETCNGLDDNCDGLIDNGKNLCPKGQTCYQGECITD
ncbi:MAG: VWA domain-containing protein, partial [Deltaproteobacteria bacterium]|nr:VWA domain-containing protein [Deltaproteobacteria bacterium]